MRKLLLPALFAATVACSTPSRISRTAPPNTPELRVMTYNVNYGLAGDPQTLAAIKSRAVDLVLLQETNEAWETLIRADPELLASYPHMAFYHCCLAGGLGLLSKEPIKEQQHLEQIDWFPALIAVIGSPVGDVQVLNVHLRPQISDSGSVISGYFSTPEIRKAEITAFSKHLDPKLPTLVVGDFNESEDGDAIEILEARGFATVLPEFQPSADTWRWNTSLGEISTRLDHIVYDQKKLEPLDARVLSEGRSDHLPVVATFVLAR